MIGYIAVYHRQGHADALIESIRAQGAAWSVQSIRPRYSRQISKLQFGQEEI